MERSVCELSRKQDEGDSQDKEEEQVVNVSKALEISVLWICL